MSVFHEGDLHLTIPDGVSVRKFDDHTHGLTHCMKAVDFIIELQDRYLFIELKDPFHPKSRDKDREKWISNFLSGKIDEDFKYKYRDSFLYEWASKKIDKPIYYYVLVAINNLTEAELITRTDALKRKIPLHGPSSGSWKRDIIKGCMVFNIETWNKNLTPYPVTRATSE